MKKIVGIIAALALAGSVFARPDITPVITEFKGDATLEWIANLDGAQQADKSWPNELTTGMANSTSSSFKIQMRTDDWGGDSTTGDGLWGEVTVRTGGGYTAEKGGQYGWTLGIDVSEAKIHFVDGDMYFNMQILQPSFSVGEIGYVRAIKNYNCWEDSKWFAVSPEAKVTTAAVAAKAGEYYLDAETGTIKQKDATAAVAAKTEYKAISGYQGFTLNFGLPIVDLSFAFDDNGEKIADAKEFAFRFAATLKPIDGLSLYAGIAATTEEDSNLAAAFTAAYNYNIDDQFYLKPALQFTMVGKKMDLSAGLLFGWGSGGAQWRSDFLNFTKSINVAAAGDRTTDGLSILYSQQLKDADGNTPADPTSLLVIEAFDSKLLGDAGVTWGASYRAGNVAKVGDNIVNQYADLGKGQLALAAIYNTNIDIMYLTARVSFGMDLGAVDAQGKATKDNFGVKYGLRVGTKELIANTDVYLDYVGCFSKYAPDNNNTDVIDSGVSKGTVKVGTKISF